MTLIPMISALAAAPGRRAVAAGPAMAARGGYDPGAGHRPVAAALAIGLPVALVVAVALSPMIIREAPQTEEAPWKTIFLPTPKPPEPPEVQPKAQQQPKSAQATETVKPVFKLPTDSDNSVVKGPPVLDPPRLPDPGPVYVDPPAPPKLVLAQADPRYAGLFQPEYPLREERAGVEGSVTLRVLIGTDGRVKAVELVRTDSPAFFDAAKKRALSKWRFKPATRGGTPEESWKEMTVRFQIKNA
jgi:protein TonB